MNRHTRNLLPLAALLAMVAITFAASKLAPRPPTLAECDSYPETQAPPGCERYTWKESD